MTAPGTAREEHQAMEFSVTKSALLNELSTTQGVVERKTTIPILSNLLVEAKGSHLTITAKKLLELVRLLPEGEIKVKLLENYWVEIVSDRKKYKLVGMAKENFPALPAMPHSLVKIPAAILESLIAKTKLAISIEGIEISASSPEYGEAKENIEKEYKGDAIAIGFNSSYMLDYLAAAADGPVSIELKDEQSAGQMRPLADENYRYRYIIMPMRI